MSEAEGATHLSLLGQVQDPYHEGTRVVRQIDMQLARTYGSWGELKGSSTLVVVGTAAEQHSSTDARGLAWTSTTVRVDRVVESSQHPAPQEVTVRQMGRGGEDSVTVTGFPLLPLGGRYLLFLTPTVVTSDEYYPVGAYQGAFTVSSDDLVNPLSPQAEAVGVPVHGAELNDVIRAIVESPAVPGIP